MPMAAAEAQDLGNLINDLNPYFDATIGPGLAVAPPIAWEMDLYLGAPPAVPPAGLANQIEVQVDSEYAGQWNFAGQPQNIARAVRIRYRYPARSPSGQVYWREDYLLIGYEGSGGGN